MFRNGLQLSHVIVVLIIVVLLFGARRLPDAAKSIGQSLKIFKNEIKDLKADDAAPVPPASPAPAAQSAANPAAAPESSPAAAEPPTTPPASPDPDQVPPPGAAPQA